MKNMEEFFPILLRNCPLFAGFDEADLRALLMCLSAVRKHFEKNTFVFVMDERAGLVGIVLSGAVHVVREDFWGGREILTRVEPGGLFGEAFACAGVEKLPVSAVADEESHVLLLDCQRFLKPCPSACTFHHKLIKNLTHILARKNVMLTQKLECVTRRTTREKLLCYLSERARLAGGRAFDIPFDRQELADYLSVDRSAMSAELSKMRTKGLLRYHRNHFELPGAKHEP
ncbi:MAG: Crp/Fnr family transcriptional regulator [Synergistaceae bacterium]|jgi:CRP-like cAMP-binding protein|nr:Crp/Fnr family transcriptional regulator [Synergistaceae bacterium]